VVEVTVGPIPSRPSPAVRLPIVEGDPGSVTVTDAKGVIGREVTSDGPRAVVRPVFESTSCNLSASLPLLPQPYALSQFTRHPRRADKRIQEAEHRAYQ